MKHNYRSMYTVQGIRRLDKTLHILYLAKPSERYV